MKMVYFDITKVAGFGDWEPKKDLIAKRTREIGVDRVLFGSDGYFGGGVTPMRALADFRSLPPVQGRISDYREQYHTLYALSDRSRRVSRNYPNSPA